MKKILFLVFASFMLITVDANAQERQQRQRQTPEQQADTTVQRMHKLLELTDKQQKEVKAWSLENTKKKGTYSNEDRSNREAMRTQFIKDRKEANAKLEIILTKEQYKKYKENAEKIQGSKGGQKQRGKSRR